jgi:alpha-beta hydrolase superfamily lysophospholipase
MKMLRRAIVALSMAGAIFATLRMRGKGGVPPQVGGWREVDVPPR